MSGGLFDPLGADRAEPPRRAGRPPASAIVLAALVGALAALLALSWLRDDGDRGRPTAVAPIERAAAPPRPDPLPAPPPSPAPPPVAPQAAAGPQSAVPPPPRDDQEVEVQNGVRIVRPRRDPPPGGGRPAAIPVPAPAR